MGANESGKTNLLLAMQSFSLETDFKPEDISKSRRRKYERKEPPRVSFTFSLSKEDRENLVPILPQFKDWHILKINKNKNNVEGYTLIIPKENLIIKSQNEINEIEFEMKNVENEIINIKKTLKEIQQQKNEIQKKILETNHEPDLLKELNKKLENLTKDYTEKENKLEGLEETKKSSFEAIKKIKEKSKQGKDTSVIINKENMSKIINLIPKIVYIKDLEFIPEKIPIQELIQQNTPKSKTIGNLLKIGYVEDFKSLNEELWRVKPMLRYTSNLISEKINETWKQERLLLDLTKEGENLVISIQERIAISSPPQERSEGFQWFLSFFANFMLESNKNQKRKIILLDEPAILLFPKGQKDFLEVVEEISNNNQVIYTSHSPFLVNRNFPHRIRVLEKDPIKGTLIKNKPYFDGRPKFWEPLRSAIGICLADLLSFGEINLVVEGISDQIIITGISNKLASVGDPFLNLEKITIVPAMGAFSAAYLGQFAISEDLKAIVLVDNDSEGKKIIKKVKDESLELNVISVNQFKDGAVTIEDLIPMDKYIDAVNSFYDKIKFAEYKKYEDQIETEIKTSRTQSIIKKLSNHFKTMELSFNKVSVAKELIQKIEIDEKVIHKYDAFIKLFELINNIQ